MSFSWRFWSYLTFWYVVSLLTILCISFYFVLGRGDIESITTEFLNKQQIIARAEASNTTIFFERIGDGVATLAQLKSIESLNANAIHDLDGFIEQRRDSGFIGGVILTDMNGIVKLNSNILGTKDIGQSLANREYFAWAKEQAKDGDYYISKPVISRTGVSKGQMIIPVVSPVYLNGKFSGIVTASVFLKPLVERFFGLMKVSDQTQIQVIDQDGGLIYSNSYSGAVGSNISGLFLDDQALKTGINNALNIKKEGQFISDKQLVAYAPISLGSQDWLLIISSDKKEVENMMRPVYIRLVAILILTALTFLLFAAFSVKKKPG